jgi:hypothetical protein
VKKKKTIKRTLTGTAKRDTLLKVYKIMPFPILLRGSERWTLTKQQQSRIKAAEMRRLGAAGHRRTDNTRN